MSCDHCKAAIAKQIDGLEGVRLEAIDLDAGTVTVAADGEDFAVASAIEEAGYTVTGTAP